MELPDEQLVSLRCEISAVSDALPMVSEDVDLGASTHPEPLCLAACRVSPLKGILASLVFF